MTHLTRRAFSAALAAGAATGLAGPSLGQASDWPNRPVNVIMPLQAGSASDVGLRLFLDRVTEQSGARFAVENLIGAAGMIGASRAAAAEPDGYTLAALNNSILTILPNIQKRKLNFEPFASFVPITGIATIPTFLGVHKDVPASTVPELIALTKARNGELTYASGGAGSPQHLATEMFMAMTGTKMAQVAYRGATAAVPDLAGGHVQTMFIALSLAMPFLPSGNIRLIGFGGPERHPAFPTVPTVAEQGVRGFDYSSWIALFAPAATPQPVVARLRSLSVAALAEQRFQEKLSAAGLAPWPKAPDQLTQAMREDDERWKAVVSQANITI